MAFSLYKIIKGLLISEENTLTPKQIEITPGGTASTKTTILSSQTTNQTITIPDATTTLVGTDTTQTLQNKGIDNTNTVTLKDTLFTLQDDADTTKQAKFQLSSISTGTTRTYTFPDVTDNITTNTATQTLTNKGISGSSNTITNVSLTTAVTGTLPIANGGTGQTSQTNAFDALAPSTTKGDLIVYNGTDNVRQAVGTNDFVLTADSTQSTGIKWAAAAATPSSQTDLFNLGLQTTVASNALTIALKQGDGSTDPSTGSSAVKIGFRSTTASSGGFNQRSVTSSLSLVISSGSTLGTVSGKQAYLWIYAVDSDGAGTIKLAISSRFFSDGSLQTTTAEGGAGAADSAQTLYSDAAYTSKPIRLIGRILVTETTAGTWATAPSEVVLAPACLRLPAPVFSASVTGSKTLAPNNSSVKVPFDLVSGTDLTDPYSGFDTTNNRYYIPFTGQWTFNSLVYINSTNVLANRYELRFFVNGSIRTAGDGMVTTASAILIKESNVQLDLNVGDYVEVFLFGAGNNSASTLSTDSGAFTTVHFTGAWRGIV